MTNGNVLSTNEDNQPELDNSLNSNLTANVARNETADQQKLDIASTPNTEENLSNNNKSSKSLPKPYECVKMKIDDNEWECVKILNRAGKVGKSGTGKHKNWMNVKSLKDDTEYSVDWERVSEWQPLKYNEVNFTKMKNDQFQAAREVELGNWKKMEVYEEVEDMGQSAISTRWVYSEKRTETSTVKKARLIARGYEEESKTFNDSPTGNKDSLRVVVSIISSMNWNINSFDVKAAFLQGKLLDRDIYLRPPVEAQTKGKLWKLRRCVYGLNDASRYWYLRVREELSKLGCVSSKADPAVFYLHNEARLEGILLSHVDDFIWAGNEHFQHTIVDKIKSIFKISVENTAPFKYIGIDVYQDAMAIYLSQKEYVNELKEIPIDPLRKNVKDYPVTSEEKESLRSLIGQLNWLATQTRPDLSYAVSELSSAVKEATVAHLLKANKIVKHCKNNNISICFPKLNLNDIRVRCYSDASYGKLTNGGSQGGMYVEIIDSNDNSSPIWWHSSRISRVVDNVMAAETLALKEALDTGFLIKSLISELLYQNKVDIPLEAVVDSKSLYEAAYSTKSAKDKRLRIELAIIREYILNNQCKLLWVPTEQQLADIFTKDGVDSSNILSHISKDYNPSC